MPIINKRKRPDAAVEDGIPTLELLDLIRQHADEYEWCEEVEEFLERSLGLHFRERVGGQRLRLNRRYKVPKMISRERLDFILRAARITYCSYSVGELATKIRNRLGVAPVNRTYHVKIETDLEMESLLTAARRTGDGYFFNVSEPRLQEIIARAVQEKLDNYSQGEGHPFDGTITVSDISVVLPEHQPS